jgi:hypothetical protein
VDESIGLKSSFSITAMAVARIVRKNDLRCWNASDSVAAFVLIALGRSGETVSRDSASSRLLPKVVGWMISFCVCDDFMVK